MLSAKQTFSDSHPNWEAVFQLRELEKSGYHQIRILLDERRYLEARQVLDLLKEVGIV